MSGNVRQRMITGALDLLARKGLQATSFAEVTAATATPRGSIYHHFPGGKQEMVDEALQVNCAAFITGVAKLPRTSPADFIAGSVASWRAFIDERDFEAGCAVAAVTIAAENDEQLDQTAEVFRRFLDAIEVGLTECGVREDAAVSFAPFALSTLEGAVILARAARNFDSFDRAGKLLIEYAGMLPTT